MVTVGVGGRTVKSVTVGVGVLMVLDVVVGVGGLSTVNGVGGRVVDDVGVCVRVLVCVPVGVFSEILLQQHVPYVGFSLGWYLFARWLLCWS